MPPRCTARRSPASTRCLVAASRPPGQPRGDGSAQQPAGAVAAGGDGVAGAHLIELGEPAAVAASGEEPTGRVESRPRRGRHAQATVGCTSGTASAGPGAQADIDAPAVPPMVETRLDRGPEPLPERAPPPTRATPPPPTTVNLDT